MTMTGCQRSWHGKISTPPTHSYLPIFTAHSPRTSGTKSIANRLSYYQICCRVRRCCHSLLPRWRRPSISNRKSTYCNRLRRCVRATWQKWKQANYRMPLSHFLPIWQRWILIIAVIVWCKLMRHYRLSSRRLGLRKRIIWIFCKMPHVKHFAICWDFISAWPAVAWQMRPCAGYLLRRCMIAWARRLLNALSIVLYCCLRTAIARRCW